jgi:hypothetical protein
MSTKKGGRASIGLRSREKPPATAAKGEENSGDGPEGLGKR